MQSVLFIMMNVERSTVAASARNQVHIHNWQIALHENLVDREYHINFIGTINVIGIVSFSRPRSHGQVQLLTALNIRFG